MIVSIYLSKNLRCFHTHKKQFFHDKTTNHNYRRLKHGFVVITGTQKGRIGRYTKQSTEDEKARVYFSYEGDEQKYTNYSDFLRIIFLMIFL
jgi:hypothetical protein